MRLRTRLLVAACGTALACGGFGSWLLGLRSSQRGAELLDHDLRIGATAVERQLELYRAQRTSVYQAIARQPYLRAYLLAGDKAQMCYYAEAARKDEATAAAIVDGNNVLCARGAGAAALTAHASEAAPPKLATLDGKLLELYRLPIDGTPGALLVAEAIDTRLLRADGEPFDVEVALQLGKTTASTLAGLSDVGAGDRERLFGKTRFRVAGRDFGGGRLIVAVPTERVGALTTEAARLNVALLIAILAFVGVGTVMVMRGLTEPIQTLEQAAAQLAHGHLDGSAATLRRLAARGDEIGDIASCYASASERLAALIAASVELSDNLAPMMMDIEKLSGALSDGAGRQNDRSQDLSNTFEQLDATLETVTAKVGEAYTSAQQLTLDFTSLDSIAKRIRKHGGEASNLLVTTFTDGVADPMTRVPELVGERLASISKHVDEQVDKLMLIDGRTLALVQRLSDAMQAQAKSKHRRAVAWRAIEDAQRLADRRAEQMGRLHKSAAALRVGLRRLDSILATLRA
jgi:hypothetical protein